MAPRNRWPRRKPRKPTIRIPSPMKRAVLPAAVAAAGSATFGAWYRLFRQPLPKTEGKLKLKGLEGPVRILRDRHGVPHVRARTINDLAYAQGFCHGQDRLFQIDFLRRVTAGRLAELAGDEMLPIDRLMRTLGFGRLAQAEVAVVPGSVLEPLTAYSLGVNAAIDAARLLPTEMLIAGIEPGKWTPADTLAFNKLVALGLSTNWEMELFRAELLRDFGPELLETLEPRYPSANPVVLRPGEAFSGHGLKIAEQIAAAREAIGLGLQPGGSNNWVVSGERSVTGKPLLAADPHLTATIPALFYEMQLVDDEANVCGASVPGSLGLIWGHSEHVAWSFTNAMADTMDLFTERLRHNQDGTTDHEFKGRWRRAAVVTEEIEAKGKSQPELLDVVITRHGPVINHALGADADPPLALRWTGLEETLMAPGPILGSFGRAKSGAELNEMMGGHSTPPLNLVWADVDGNIGYHLVGHIPKRAGGAPDVPKPGWTGEFDWDGYVPHDELPSLTNPDSGYIVTANNRIVGDDYPHHITSEWFGGYRARRIEDLLADRERHSIEDFEAMQADVYSIPGTEIAHRLTLLNPAGEHEAAAVRRLKTWDGNLNSETVAGTIVHAFSIHFARAVAKALIGDRRLEEKYLSKSATGFFPVVATPWRFFARVLELWAEADPELLKGKAWDDLALEALGSALDELEDRFGKNPDRWQWGEVHGLDFAHPFGDANRVLARIFCRSLPAGGAVETVAQIGYVPTDPYRGTWMPGYRHIADLSDPSNSRWLVATGQSGHVGSKHYDDLMNDWLQGRTRKVYRTEDEVIAAGDAELLELEPR